MAVNERIRKMRISKKMTQHEVAERCGMLDSAVRRCEAGNTNLKPETIMRLAKALDVSVAYLLDFSDEEEKLVLNYEQMMLNAEQKYDNPKFDKEDIESLIDICKQLIEPFITIALAREALPIRNEKYRVQLEQMKEYENQKVEDIKEYKKMKAEEMKIKEKEREQDNKLLNLFHKLNTNGKQTAMERVLELTQLSKYQL